MRFVKTVITFFAYPVTIAVAVYTMLHSMQIGIDPLRVLLATQVIAAGLVIVFERLNPQEATSRVDTRDVVTDVLHLFFSLMLVRQLFNAFCLAGLYALAVRLSTWTGITAWPTGWPILTQLALALVVGELFLYWMHRFRHELDVLWRVHAVHHSSTHLYWLNNVRFHPVDSALAYAAGLAAPVLLGCPREVIALLLTVNGVHGLFQHANIDVRLGPLNWVVSMAELHRWHHSTLPEESNTNYGINLILWDIVFGTRYAPAGRPAPALLGLGDMPAFPKTYMGQLLSPLRWRTLARGSGDACGDNGSPSPLRNDRETAAQHVG